MIDLHQVIHSQQATELAGIRDVIPVPTATDQRVVPGTTNNQLVHIGVQRIRDPIRQRGFLHRQILVLFTDLNYMMNQRGLRCRKILGRDLVT